MEELSPIQHKMNLRGRRVVDEVARYVGCRPLILDNTLAGRARIRFTIAHELGHLLLGHVDQAPAHTIVTPVLFRKSEAELSPEEQAANIFASRLLAPACVLWGLGAQNAEQIAAVCDISQEAASYRMERLRKLYRRNDEFLQTRGHPCFLQSPLERRVYGQFEAYIQANRL